MKYIKVFDKDHKILDEIHEYNTLVHGFVLNTISKCSFNVPLNSIKCTQANFLTFNCLEIWDDTSCLWWGVIGFATPYGAVLQVMCYDYLFMLQKTVAVGETVTLKLNALMINEIANFNIMSKRHGTTRPNLAIGHSEISGLAASSIIYSDEDYYKRVQEISTQFNYDFDIDQNFNYNYYLRKGTDKPQYSINYGTGEGDNTVGTPTYTTDPTSMANTITFRGGTWAYNQDSINLYGAISAPTAVSLDSSPDKDILNAIFSELARDSYPSVGIQLDFINSQLCPFNDISVGDKITINLPTYLGYNALMRIIELEFNDMTGVCTGTFGNIIYRPTAPQKKIYTR